MLASLLSSCVGYICSGHGRHCCRSWRPRPAAQPTALLRSALHARYAICAQVNICESHICSACIRYLGCPSITAGPSPWRGGHARRTSTRQHSGPTTGGPFARARTRPACLRPRGPPTAQGLQNKMSRSRIAAPVRTPLARAIAAGLALGLYASSPSPALAADSNGELQEVTITTGSRGKAVTVTDSPSPIDVISGEQIRATGKASLREILGTIAPSYTAPSQPGGGTSASIRPAKIRGLSGDLLLVLVNGKRRHNSAVYNNFGTGSVPTDLDLIPVSAIERIELLRDGAAAQYGSDAIAGVLNIILKRSSSGATSTTTVGRQSDKPGDLVQQGFSLGRELGSDGGFVHLAADLRLQGPSYSAGDAQGSFYYPLLNGQPVAYGTAGATADPRDATVDRLLAKGTGRSNRDKVLSTSYNAELPVSEALTLYSFGTLSYRSVIDTRGTFRPNSVSSRPEIYPDGFAAQRLISQPDYQLAAGGKGVYADWNWDLSTTWATDLAQLSARNTINASLPDPSQTHFYLG
ncbi:MAG: hypothetical protein EPO12_21065, partial [Aquabacterium sp.]